MKKQPDLYLPRNRYGESDILRTANTEGSNLINIFPSIQHKLTSD